MSFLIDLVLFGLAWYIGLLFGSSVTMIGCCVFCAFPLIRKIDDKYDSVDLKGLKSTYRQSIMLHGTLLAGASFLVSKLLPVIMQRGFFFSLVFTVLIGFRQWGVNDANLADFLKIYLQYVKPDMKGFGYLALLEALERIPSDNEETEEDENEVAKELREKKLAKNILCILTAFLLFVIGYAFSGEAETTTARNNVAVQTNTVITTEPAEIHESLLEWPRAKTGIFSTTLKDDCIAPFKLTAKSDTDCYCVLERTSGQNGAIKFFARKGENIEFDVPLGTYRLYFSTGDGTWYGRTYLFGYDGNYYMVNATFEFKESSTEYTGWEIDLNNADGSNCYIIDYEAMP